MENVEATTSSTDEPGGTAEQTPVISPTREPAVFSPRVADPGCRCGMPGGTCVCGAAYPPESAGDPAETYRYVYAIGRVQPRFPTLAVEKEFAQAVGREDTEGLTDRQTLHDVLSKRDNRYLARQLCYVLTVEGLETYLLQPRDPADLDLLIDAIRPAPSPMDVDVVIGIRGPIAPPEMCNGLMVPIVAFTQIYSFDHASLIQSIPRPQGMSAKQFEPVAAELFDRIIQMADNAGATDEHRAMNYVAVRYPAIYATTAAKYAQDFSLTEVEVRPSPLGGVRNIVDIVLSYTNRTTDFTEKVFARADVTEEFPFLVSKLSPYYDR